MGKLKKISIAFVGLIVLFYIVNLVTSGEIERVIPTSTVANDKSTSLTNDQPKEKSYMMMSDFELNQIKMDWQYRDLLRNIDDYSGKIIFVEGVVTNVQRDIGLLNLCVDGATVSFNCDEFMFVVANGNKTWLEEDNLAGYVEVYDLGEVFYSNMFTGEEQVGSGDYVPRVKEIKLTCSNC